MPITAMYDQNDARGAARLLARAAAHYIADPGGDGDREVALNNVYRLLESYRATPFFGADLDVEPLPAEGGGTEALTLVPPFERNIGEVRDALKDALEGTFANQQPEEALDFITAVLRSVAYPQPGQAPNVHDREQVEAFFRRFLEELPSD